MAHEDIHVAEVPYRLIRLPQYEKDIRDLRRIEPNLHEEIRASIKRDVESGRLDEIRGTGGWVKGRVASPSRNIGKSGGFRVIYLLFRVQHDIYLQSVYDHRDKSDLTGAEIKALNIAADAIKRAYAARESKNE